MVITNIRIPGELHARLKEHAAEHRRSLNAEMLYLLERALDAGL